jgi:hypothetical protein
MVIILNVKMQIHVQEVLGVMQNQKAILIALKKRGEL